MGLFSKKEFAQRAGVTTRYLSNYIRRGNIFLTDDGDFLDDSVPQNAAFLDRMSAKKTKVEKGKKKKTTHAAAAPVTDPAVTEKRNARFDLDLRKKELDIAKTERETELLAMNLNKKSGVLIPTDLVKALFSQHAKSMTVSFYQAVENLLVDISKKAHLTAEDLSNLRGKLKEIVNSAVDNSVEESKKTLTTMLADFSDRKNSWERVK